MGMCMRVGSGMRMPMSAGIRYKLSLISRCTSVYLYQIHTRIPHQFKIAILCPLQFHYFNEGHK